MVFVAEAFGAWLLERAAGAGSKRLAESVLGGEQQRALRQAATAAIQRTAEDLHPEGGEQAAHLMMVVDHVFSEPVPRALLGERTTVVQALQVGVAEQLAVLGDASMTGVGTSSADLLGVRVAQLVQTLTRNLLHEILVSGAGGGPLTPLADQLNHDIARLQSQELSGTLAQLAEDVHELRTKLDPREPAAVMESLGGQVEGWPAYIYEGATVARLSYRHEVGQLLVFYTESFVGRKAELAKLIQFAAQEEPGYGLVEARAGYGKSAVVAQLVHRHESGQWNSSAVPALVYFFVREEGSRHSPEAFCLAVNSQLLDLLELPGGVPAELEAQRSQLLVLWTLAVGAASAERPLLLLVDGLDEMAQGPVTITDLLPTHLGPYVHVVVTSRPTSEPFSQVPLEHPLRQAEVTRVQMLDDGDVAALLMKHGSPSEFANAVAPRVVTVTKGEPLLIRFVAEDVAAGGEAALEGLERDPPAGVKSYFARQFRQLEARAAAETAWMVLGLLLVARGAMAVEELAGVLELPKRQVSKAIAPIRRFLLGRERLELMHLVLRAVIAEHFSSGERQAYKAQLLSWCNAFRAQGWPDDTPHYVLDHYANHLLEVGDYDGLYSLVNRRWMELKVSRTRSHQAFATDVLLAIGVAAAEEPPNLVQEVRGLLVRATLNSTSANVPLDVISIIARTGPVDRAMSQAALISNPERRSAAYLAIAESIHEQSEKSEVLRALHEAEMSASSVKHSEDQVSALTSVARTLLGTGERRRALDVADKALQVAKKLKNRTHRISALSKVGEVLALAGEFDQALTIAEAVDDPVRKAHVVVEVAKLLILAGASERALQVVMDLDHSDESLSTRLGIVRALASAGEYALAVDQAELVLQAAEMMTDRKTFVLASAAQALAEMGEGDRAVEVFEQALRIAEAAEDTWRALLVLPMLIAAMLQAGEDTLAAEVTEKALQAAGIIGDPDEKAAALASAAKAFVQLGKPMEAVELIQLVLPAAESIDDPEQQALTLFDLIQALLGVRRFEQALDVVAIIDPNSGLKSQVLAYVSRLVAEAGERDIALRAAEAPGDPGERAYALAGVAEALLAAGDPLGAERVVERALRAAEAFHDPQERAPALAEVAKAMARADEPQHAEDIAERALQTAELAEETSQELPFWRLGMVKTLIQAGKFEHALRAATPIARGPSNNASFLIEIADDFARAQRFDNALEITEAMDDPVSRAFAFSQIGCALAQFGKRAQAAELLERVLRSVEVTSDAKDRVVLLCAAARVLAKAEDRERAKQIVHQARQIAEAMDDPELRPFAVVRVLETLTRVGEPDQALSIAHGLSDSNHDFAFTAIAVAAGEVEDLPSAMTAAEAIGNLTERVLALAWIAEALAGTGERKRIAELAKLALSVAESLGDTPRKVWALNTLSRTLFRIEDFAQAKRSFSMMLMAASNVNRSEYLRALGDVAASSGKAYQGQGETLWGICEVVCEVDDWWFDDWNSASAS